MQGLWSRGLHGGEEDESNGEGFEALILLAGMRRAIAYLATLVKQYAASG